MGWRVVGDGWWVKCNEEQQCICLPSAHNCWPDAPATGYFAGLAQLHLLLQLAFLGGTVVRRANNCRDRLFAEPVTQGILSLARRANKFQARLV
jgi:hypothetical protein